MNFIDSFSLIKNNPIFQKEKLGWGKYLLILLGFCLALMVLKFKFYAVALVGGLIGVVFLLFNPEAALLVNINISQLFLIKVIAVTLPLLILSWIPYMVRRKPAIFISLQSKLLLILVIWVLFIAPFNSYGFWFGLRYSVRLLLPIISFYMITTIIKTDKQLMRFIFYLIVCGLALSILGNIQLFFQIGLFPTFTPDPNSIVLPTGPYGDPVAYGAQLTAILGLCFSRFLGESEGKVKTFFLFILLAMMFSLFASLNRSAILGFGIFTITMLVLNRKGGIKLILFFTIGLIIITQIGVGDLFLKRIETIFRETQTKTGHFGNRLETTLAGLELLRANPQLLIFGGGLNTYQDLILPYLSSTAGIRHSQNTNAIIFFLVELGIFGLVLLLSIIGLSLKNLYSLQKIFSESGDHLKSFISQGVFSSLIALLFISIINTIWDMTLFWVNLALPVVMMNIWKTQKEGEVTRAVI